MKKSEKGFTLIELLVVVAIIGILAAVGVVAYSGYTAGAKKSASKSNQATVVKYIAAEMKKCSMGEVDAMRHSDGVNKLTCSGMNGAKVITAAKTVLEPEFKNPYDNANSAIVTGATATATVCSDTTKGQTHIGSVTGAAADTIYVHTCYSKATADIMSNAILVE